MRIFGIVATTCFILLVPGSLLRADTVHVTHYVTKVQEERRSTRFTLTEWLLIKERMRMMDVWLAMFSSPKKDEFKPEINLEYGKTRGTLNWQDEGLESFSSTTAGSEMRATFWLTNLITASTGLRTLNIDLGLEGFVKDGGSYQLVSELQALTDISGRIAGPTGINRLQNYTGNLRLFGKSTQDTSLVLKYGQFDLNSSLMGEATGTAAKHAKGITTGAALNIYLTGFLGVEGNAMRYRGESLPEDLENLGGQYYDYSAFVEVSLLRLMVGRYREDWSFKSYGAARTTSEQGLLAGVKLQL